MIFSQKLFSSSVTHKVYDVIFGNKNVLDCGSENIIYLISCKRCALQYVGETVNSLRLRMNGHRDAIRKNADTLLASHFNGPCTLKDFSVQPIESIGGNGRDEKSLKFRKLRESFWMKELRTVYPYGLNDRCNGQDWSNKSDEDISCLIFNKLNTFRKKHCHKKSYKSRNSFDICTFLANARQRFLDCMDWLFFCHKTVASLSKKIIKSLLFSLDELVWKVAPDYPMLVLQVIRDLAGPGSSF
jgi:hypothetical protein